MFRLTQRERSSVGVAPHGEVLWLVERRFSRVGNLNSYAVHVLSLERSTTLSA
jgi:hypothetical protein